MNFLRGSGGPTTAEGLARCVRASWKHGRRSKSAMREAASLRDFLRHCRKTIAKAHGIETPESAPKAAPIKAFKATKSEHCPTEGGTTK